MLITTVASPLLLPVTPFSVTRLPAHQEHKLQTGLGLFALTSLATSALATGAFEVYINDNINDQFTEPVLSRLLTGQFPTRDELISAVAKVGLQPAFDPYSL